MLIYMYSYIVTKISLIAHFPKLSEIICFATSIACTVKCESWQSDF